MSRDPARDLKAIAQALGVRYVLDGSVRGSGGKLRVTVRLVAALSGEQLWQVRFDGNQSDEFDLQERIAAGVGSEIDVRIVGTECDRILALAPEIRSAFDWYLLSVPMSLDWRRDSLEQARIYALEALRLNPGFALAHAMLGWIYSVIYQSSWNDDPAETLRLGLEHSARALNGAEQDWRVLGFYASAHSSFGTDLTAVEAMLTKAVSRAPENMAMLQVLAWTMLCQGGRPRRTLDMIREQMARDPNSPIISYGLIAEAACLLLLGRFEEAIAPARETVARRPDYLNGEVILASVLGHSRKIDEARKLIAGFRSKGRIENTLAVFRNAEERAIVRKGLELAGLDD